MFSLMLTLGRFLLAFVAAIATDPITGRSTTPTKIDVNVKTDKEGNVTEKTVEFPNDPQIQLQGDTTGPRPQTQISGFAQGGTTNPPVGESPDPKWYAPTEDGEVGAEEENPQAMFERDEAVNPRGDGHGRGGGRFTEEFGTAEDPVYVPADNKSKSDSKDK